MSKTYIGHADGRVMIEWSEGGRGPLPTRLDLRNHSPTGFGWGYGGSGPAQLALALLTDLIPDEPAKVQQAYQALKWEVVARLAQNAPWTLSEEDLLNWLRAWESCEFAVEWLIRVAATDLPPDGGREYERVRSAWVAAGRPMRPSLTDWITEECLGIPHTLIV